MGRTVNRMIRFDSAIDAQTWLDQTAAGHCSLLTRQNRWEWIAGELQWLCKVSGAPGSVRPVVVPVVAAPARERVPIKVRQYSRGAYARRFAADAVKRNAA